MGKKVLVADDSATIQRAFSMVFGGLQGSISLVPARNFDEAMSLARQGRPDLVIADIALGNRTGYELCAALKGDPGLRGLPVLILGSGQTPYDEGKGRQAGADGHLSKPFESQSLIDRVHEALARPVAVVPPRAEAPAPPPVVSARPVGARPAVATIELDDEYGEFTIERSSSGSAPRATGPVLAPTPPPMSASAPLAASARTAPPSPVPSSPFAPAASAPAAATVATGSGAALRPSLIPGARPTPAVNRPPVPLHSSPGVASASVAPPTAAAQRPAPAPAPALPKRPEPPRLEPPPLAAGVQAGMGRTIMGLPAVAIPGPAAPREARPAAPTVVPNVVSAPAPAPAMVPAPAPAPAPSITPIAPGRPPVSPGPFPLAPVTSADSAAVVSARIDQKVAAIAARGPEYEAVAKLSREVIEQVVWEVVPELAEVIIREHIERLASTRK